MMAFAWHTDPQILTLGRSVVDDPTPTPQLSARSAARLLFGAVGLVSARYGVAEMQAACAELVRCDVAWSTKFGTLPRRTDGSVPEAVSMIAGMARGILPMAGPLHLRAALAFWASERDPSVWRSMMPCD